MRFKNRIDAGQQLAEKLAQYILPHAQDETLILALPRGGVPVGFEVALKLKAPLDTIVVRKIGAPGNPEFGIGAIAPGDVIILDNVSILSLGLSKQDLDVLLNQEMQEMDRRITRYKSGEYSTDILAETVIIVDDGLATGVTARAAIESAKIIQQPRKIIFAAPVCAKDTAQILKRLVDKIVCLQEIDNLMAIGHWYEEFNQTTDEEVVEYLERARASYG